MQQLANQAPVFDAAKYKQTTRAQWETAAQAWYRWTPFLESWLGPATERMLDLAGVRAGAKVLDIAAGAGGQTLAAAKRVGNAGSVLATDISPAILEFALAAARSAGVENVRTQELDGELHERLHGHSFDAAISRLGLIYFPDQPRALAGVKHALKPGGKFAAIVYSTADRNAFFAAPVAIIRRRAALPPPLPGQPGPFSLGADGVLAATLERAGFRDVSVHRIDAPVQLASAAECVRFERESFGALHQMLSGLSPADQEAAWTEIRTELEKFDSPRGFEGPCELLVGAGTA